MKNKNLAYFWNRERKSQKTVLLSSPSSEHQDNVPPLTPTQHDLNQEDQVTNEATLSPTHYNVNQDEQVDEEADYLTNQAANETDQECPVIPPQSEDCNVFSLNPPHDPGERKPISSYSVNDRDVVRRIYIAKGLCRPRPKDDFPQKLQGNTLRRFNATWYDTYDWLECSEKNDAAFCFYCYLFKDPISVPEANAFENGGFSYWKRALDKFRCHVGKVGSAHNFAREKYVFFVNKEASIMEILDKASNEAKNLYKSRLLCSLSCVKFLLRQGLAFRGHDESVTSKNKGNFLELLDWLGKNSESVGKVILTNAPENNQLTCSRIQKELIKCCAEETLRLIVKDHDGDLFGILADESSDVSHKEELAICLRYVNKKGKVCERFIGIVHVKDTTSLKILEGIRQLLDDHSLSMSNIRGQGYDGANNMRGELNGLRNLIMRNNPCAFYVHCFAHQLQLTLVAVARENKDCSKFFLHLGIVLNNIGYSCKRMEMVRDIQADKVLEALASGECESGKGLNQERGLSRPGDTRWESHFKSILNLLCLYGTVINVLEVISKDAKSVDDRAKAEIGIDHLESFEFVFMLHLMKVVYGYTNSLCEALQRKDQDIVNAMAMVNLTKRRLEKFRNNEWDEFLLTVSNFCGKYKIEVPNMTDFYAPPERSRRRLSSVTNLHRFRVDMFISVIDLQVQELNSRFNEINMELVMCMACLSPRDHFSSFDKEKLVRLAKFYPSEFNEIDIMTLEFELDIFVSDMRNDSRFHLVKSLGELSIMLVETRKNVTYPLVYLLLKLVLILPVATASVERVFSSMKFVKNKLRNRMGDDLLNDCLIPFVERDFFSQISDDDVIRRFQNMNPRRKPLELS